jgi:hypothetical protein
MMKAKEKSRLRGLLRFLGECPFMGANSADSLAAATAMRVLLLASFKRKELFGAPIRYI